MFNVHKYGIFIKNTPAIKYVFSINNEIVAKFFVWEWWDGKNISDFEINKKYRGNRFSYIFLKYAVDVAGVRNISVEKNNEIAKHVYISFGFKITFEDNKMYYLTYAP